MEHDEESTPWLTLAEAAARLRVTPKTLRALARRDDFPPAHRISERVTLLDRDALDAWVRGQYRRPVLAQVTHHPAPNKRGPMRKAA